MDKDEYIKREREHDERKRKEFLEKKESKESIEDKRRNYGAISNRIKNLSESIKRRQEEHRLKKEKKIIDSRERKIAREKAAEVKIFGHERSASEKEYASKVKHLRELEKKEKSEKRKQAYKKFTNTLDQINSSVGKLGGSGLGGGLGLPETNFDYSGMDAMFGATQRKRKHDPLMDLYSFGNVTRKKGKKGSNPLDFV